MTEPTCRIYHKPWLRWPWLLQVYRSTNRRRATNAGWVLVQAYQSREQAQAALDRILRNAR